MTLDHLWLRRETHQHNFVCVCVRYFKHLLSNNWKKPHRCKKVTGILKNKKEKLVFISSEEEENRGTKHSFSGAKPVLNIEL